MRALKVMVVVMGVMLVGGTALLDLTKAFALIRVEGKTNSGLSVVITPYTVVQ